jgi:hypothetical protein
MGDGGWDGYLVGTETEGRGVEVEAAAYLESAEEVSLGSFVRMWSYEFFVWN